MQPVKNALYIVILFIVGACSACSSASYETKIPVKNDAIQRALAASVVLFDTSGDTVCAGQRIREDLILTAYHCVVAASLSENTLAWMDLMGVDLNDIEMKDIVGKRIRYATYHEVESASTTNGDVRFEISEILSGNSERDVALLLTKRSSQPRVRLNSQDLPVGTKLFSIGHPMGLLFSYAEGALSNFCRTERGVGPGCWLQADITIWGGSSGGGLYTEGGELVGVASARPATMYGAGPMIGFFAPAGDVETLLAAL